MAAVAVAVAIGSGNCDGGGVNTSRFFTLKRTRRCGIGRLSFLLLLCSLSLSLVAFLWRAFIFDCFLIRFLFVKNRKKRKK